MTLALIDLMHAAIDFRSETYDPVLTRHFMLLHVNHYPAGEAWINLTLGVPCWMQPSFDDQLKAAGYFNFKTGEFVL